MKNKGITLVALVITIIILLILAGITLNLTLGQNGTIQRTQYAKDEYENARQKEQEELSNLYSQMKIATNGEITINIEDLNEIIDKRIQGDTLFDGQSTIGCKLSLKKQLSDYTYIEVYFRNVNQISASPILKFYVPEILRDKQFIICESGFGWTCASAYQYNPEDNSITNTHNMELGGAKYYYFDNIQDLELFRIVGIK